MSPIRLKQQPSFPVGFGIFLATIAGLFSVAPQAAAQYASYDTQYTQYGNTYTPDASFANPNAIAGQQQVVPNSTAPNYAAQGEASQNVAAPNMYGGMTLTPPPMQQVPQPFSYPQQSLPPQSYTQQNTLQQPQNPQYAAPQQPNVPVMNVPTFGEAQNTGTASQFQTPTFQTPPQVSAGQTDNGPPLLAFGGPVGNAYAPLNQPGGAMPAFQMPGSQESPVGHLKVRERDIPEDRRVADQRYIDAWSEIRDRKNSDAWLLRMPPHAGPLANRTIGKGEEESLVLQASFLSGPIKQDDYEYDWETEETHLFNFSMLDPTRVGEQVKRWVGLGQDEEKARKHMENALNLMKQGKNLKAANEFEWAAYYWPETAVEEDARYHAAECYYREKRYKDAADQYIKLLTNFQSSPYKSEAVNNLYGIAKIWIEQVTENKAGYVNISDKSRPTFDTFGHAEKALKTIFINCPSDPMADDCVYALGIAYMRRGTVQGDASYEHAAEYFNQLRQQYSNSEHVAEAMRLEAVCRQKASLGGDYSSRHIDAARDVASQLQMQYGLEPGKQSEIVQLQNQLAAERAQQLWETAKYYDNCKEYRAARMEYQRLIDEFPATEYADRARKRYGEIRDLPDEPPTDVERIKSFFRIGGK